MYTEVENEKETESEADIHPETMEVMEDGPDAEFELKQLRERDQRIRNLGESILKQMVILEQKQSEVKAEKKRLEVLQGNLAELAVEKPEGQMEIDFAQCECEDNYKAAPVTELEGFTDAQMETLTKNFKTIGDVVAWCGDDYAFKIQGIGPAFRDKIISALDKAAGVTEEAIRAEAERGKAQRLAGEDNEPIRDAEKVSRMIKNCDILLDKIDDPDFDPATVSSIKSQLVFDGFYTHKQQKALDNIAREWLK